MELPGNPPPSVEKALSNYTHEYRTLILAHLKGGTSTNWLSDWLKRAGTPVGATTLKKYRRTL
jgi:hypothetical protein